MNINIDDLIKEVEAAEPQKIICNAANRTFELKAEESLSNDLSGNYGALFIRSIFNQLNIDESFVLKWRLENKYIQYMILEHYAPNCMPSTLPLSSLLDKKDGIKKAKKLFSQGYFLKSTLGDASYITQTWDKTGDFDQIALLENVSNGKYENYMLQKKVSIKTEFRIHTFYKDIIPGLTYLSQGEKQNYPRDLDEFLNDILTKIPNSILSGTLIAWDIALNVDNQYYIIEANFTGFHPEYRRGFQTTGYVDDHHYGSIICAWLNVYFEKYYGVYVDSVQENLFDNYPFYKAFVFYMTIFKKDHINLVRNTAKQVECTVIIYLNDDNNQLVINLIKHFSLVHFASKFHVIVRDSYYKAVFRIFAYILGQVVLHNERELFTQQQFDLIKHLGYDRRKQISCYHLLRMIKQGTII